MRAEEYMPLYLHLIVLATLVAIFLVEWKRGATVRAMVVTGACMATLAMGWGVLACLWAQESREAAVAAEQAARIEQANLEFLGAYLAQRYGDHQLVIIVNESCDPGEEALRQVAETIGQATGGKAAIVAVRHPIEFAEVAAGDSCVNLICDETRYAERRRVLLGRYPAVEVVLDLTQVASWVVDGESGLAASLVAGRFRVVLGLPPLSTVRQADAGDDGIDAYLEVRPLITAPTGADTAGRAEFVRRMVELSLPAIPMTGRP